MPRLSILNVILMAIGAAFGTADWHRLISVYWQKDLPVPINDWFWLILALVIGILSIAIFIVVFSMLFGSRKYVDFFISASALSFGLPIAHFLIDWISTKVGIQTSIFFISDDGYLFLTEDSLFLFFLGLVLGLVIASIISLLKVRTVVVK